MRRLLTATGITMVFAGSLFAVPPIPPSPESVPIGPLAIPIVAAGVIGYGIYKILKK